MQFKAPVRHNLEKKLFFFLFEAAYLQTARTTPSLGQTAKMFQSSGDCGFLTHDCFC